MTRVLVWFNPKAGAFSTKRLSAVCHALDLAGLAYEAVSCLTTTLRDVVLKADRIKTNAVAKVASDIATDRVTDAATDTVSVDVILVLGGDGTLNRVVSELIALDVSPVIGIVPMGTANVMCRDLGWSDLRSWSIADVVLGIQQQSVVAVDVMRVGRHVSLLGVGSGYDGLVVRDVNLRLKSWFGRLAYVVSGLMHLLFYRNKSTRCRVMAYADSYLDGEAARFETRPEVNSKPEEMCERVCVCNWVIVANTQYYAGGWVLNPNRDLSDGVFEAFCLSIESLWDWVLLAKAIMLGRVRDFSGCTVLTGSRFEIVSDFPFQVDGDLVWDLVWDLISQQDGGGDDSSGNAARSVSFRRDRMMRFICRGM